MPEFISKIAQRAVFSDEDPFIFSIPDIGKFKMNNYGVRLPHEDELSPVSTPVKYLIAAISGTCAAEDQERCSEALDAAYKAGRISPEFLNEVMQEIGRIYSEQTEHIISRATGLPTMGR